MKKSCLIVQKNKKKPIYSHVTSNRKDFIELKLRRDDSGKRSAKTSKLTD